MNLLVMIYHSSLLCPEIGLFCCALNVDLRTYLSYPAIGLSGFDALNFDRLVFGRTHTPGCETVDVPSLCHSDYPSHQHSLDHLLSHGPQTYMRPLSQHPHVFPCAFFSTSPPPNQ
jgi:hypothetical protein